MLPGPDQVIACPHCKGFASHFTLLSGNTFGAVVWTDGKQEAPMLPKPPPVVRCSHCRKFYWLKDARQVGSILPIGELTEAEYYLAIEKRLANDRQEEKSLRILAWWRQNDDFRESIRHRPRRPWRLTPQSQANMKALLQLLEEDNLPDRIMKAEVLRQLGEFEAALTLLEEIEAGEFANTVAQIRNLCSRNEPRVRLLER